ncbi:MAG: hypothetical protein KDB27_28605 [Planctomycetales bacterium]|nr:hypothetical protein [Planctomycetales bacterium]
MPVSGLVVSLSSEKLPRDEALQEIRCEPRIIMGTLKDNRLAIVLDTDSQAEDQQLWNWLEALPGVVLVEVAFIGFETKQDSTSE